MRRHLAEITEVIRRRDDAATKVVEPDTIDDDTRQDRRLLGVDELQSEVEPTAGVGIGMPDADVCELIRVLAERDCVETPSTDSGNDTATPVSGPWP